METSYPTPDMVLSGEDELVASIVADIRGAFATSGGERPRFHHIVDVEEIVRFVLLRGRVDQASATRPIIASRTRVCCGTCGATCASCALLRDIRRQRFALVPTVAPPYVCELHPADYLTLCLARDAGVDTMTEPPTVLGMQIIETMTRDVGAPHVRSAKVLGHDQDPRVRTR